jgi:hypothetical protein
MSQELVKAIDAPGALALSSQEIAEFQEAFAANVSSGSVSDLDLPRIKVMSGAPLWLIPGLEREETTPRIEGVVVLSRDTRIYYKSKDAGNVPPDCSSTDNITGRGTPGGKCADCPLKEFGTAPAGGGGRACKQVRQLFMLRGSSMLPEIVSLPPTSIDGAKKFFIRLAGQRIPHWGALIAIELEKAQNAAGKPYGKAKFHFIRSLSAEEKNCALRFRELCESFDVRGGDRVKTAAADAAKE